MLTYTKQEGRDGSLSFSFLLAFFGLRNSTSKVNASFTRSTKVCNEHTCICIILLLCILAYWLLIHSPLTPFLPSPQLIAMIGGLIHNSNAINGAVMSRRKKGDRVALWTRKKSSKVNLDIW